MTNSSNGNGLSDFTQRKDFTERLIELIKDDKELHDAAVRLIDSLTELNKERTIRMKERRTHIDHVR